MTAPVEVSSGNRKVRRLSLPTRIYADYTPIFLSEIEGKSPF